MPKSNKIKRLSKELARIAGLRLRPALPGDQAHTVAGVLTGRLPSDFFGWWKCPVHDTWLQPMTKPFPHWQCQVYDPEAFFDEESQDYVGGTCIFSRPAKLRTRIERRIFAVRRFIQEHAND